MRVSVRELETYRTVSEVERMRGSHALSIYHYIFPERKPLFFCLILRLKYFVVFFSFVPFFFIKEL